MKAILLALLLAAAPAYAASDALWAYTYPNGDQLILKDQPCIFDGQVYQSVGTAVLIVGMKSNRPRAIDGCFVTIKNRVVSASFNGGIEKNVPAADFERVR